jgi:hypothetical protein
LELLWIVAGRGTIQEVVANDPVSIGTDKYRVILGTHTFDVSPGLAEALQAFEPTLGGVRERRFRVLLNYDPFDRGWQVVAQDLGKQSEGFVTDTVGSTLRTLSGGLR